MRFPAPLSDPGPEVPYRICYIDLAALWSKRSLAAKLRASRHPYLPSPPFRPALDTRVTMASGDRVKAGPSGRAFNCEPLGGLFYGIKPLL